MKRYYILMFLTTFTVCFALLYISHGIDEKEKDYRTLESDLKESALAYYKIHKLSLVNGETFEIKTDDLLKENLISSMKVKEDVCTGYVKIIKKRTEFVYTPYIKCNSYETMEE